MTCDSQPSISPPLEHDSSCSGDLLASVAQGCGYAGRLAYLAGRYPALSHTFIEREIFSLRDRGFEVHTATIRPVSERELISASMKREFAATQQVLTAGSRYWMSAHARLARRYPTVWAKALARAARTGDTTPKARVWQLFYFGEAVIMHDWMRSLGLRHVHIHHANVAADVARLTCEIGESIDGPGTWSWSMTIHGSAEFLYIEQWDLAEKIRQASAVSTICDFTRSQVIRLVEPEVWERVSVIPMSTDPVKFHPPSAPREHQGPPRLLTIGRLVSEKGLPILIDAVQQLDREGTAVEVRIIGEGPLRASIEAWAERAGVADKINLLGAVGHDDLVEHYHWADAYVLPSLLEGLPVVLMEAMATGLPVIATHISGIPELVVHDENGILVRPGRADLLADAIRTLVQDSAIRLRLGESGRKAVLARFVPEVAGPAMAQFFAAQPNVTAAQPNVTAAQPNVTAAQPNVTAARPNVTAARTQRRVDE